MWIWRGSPAGGLRAETQATRESRVMGMSSMMMALIVAGVVALLAGFLSILSGIPVKEFSFGNTLILSGCIAACTGLILLGLSAVVAELKLIARRLSADSRTAAADARVRAALPQAAAPVPPPVVGAGEGGFLFSRDQSAAEEGGAPAVAPPMSPPLWQEEKATRPGPEMPAEPQPAEAVSATAAKPKRNLLFQSSIRRDRERAAVRGVDPAAASDLRSPAPVPELGETPPPSFDDAWPKTDRARRGEISPQRRNQPAAYGEPSAQASERTPPPVPRPDDQPAVTVLKSGVVDGMAYSLYSDGSIEAQMPEGLMRFASLDELTAHIERRP